MSGAPGGYRNVKDKWNGIRTARIEARAENILATLRRVPSWHWSASKVEIPINAINKSVNHRLNLSFACSFLFSLFLQCERWFVFLREQREDETADTRVQAVCKFDDGLISRSVCVCVCVYVCVYVWSVDERQRQIWRWTRESVEIRRCGKIYPSSLFVVTCGRFWFSILRRLKFRQRCLRRIRNKSCLNCTGTEEI